MSSLEQNKLGFEGDTLARDKFKSIIETPEFKTEVYRHWNGVSNKKWIEI